MTLLQQGWAAAFYTDSLLGLQDDERSGKTESQLHFLFVLMQRKERELKPWGKERKSGKEKMSIWLCLRERGEYMWLAVCACN